MASHLVYSTRAAMVAGASADMYNTLLQDWRHMRATSCLKTQQAKSDLYTIAS